MITVLVCGGRDFNDWEKLKSNLDRLHAEKHFTKIIFEDAKGADKMAFDWAALCDLKGQKFFANWLLYGRDAGPLRNKKMIDDGQPDLVIAFPGGRGTANMVKQAKTARLIVVEIS